MRWFYTQIFFFFFFFFFLLFFLILSYINCCVFLFSIRIFFMFYQHFKFLPRFKYVILLDEKSGGFYKGIITRKLALVGKRRWYPSILLQQRPDIFPPAKESAMTRIRCIKGQLW